MSMKRIEGLKAKSPVENYNRSLHSQKLFYNDMDPLRPMSFWRLVARLDKDIYPQNKCYGSAV